MRRDAPKRQNHVEKLREEKEAKSAKFVEIEFGRTPRLKGDMKTGAAENFISEISLLRGMEAEESYHPPDWPLC